MPGCDIHQISEKLNQTESMVKTIIDSAVSADIVKYRRIGKLTGYVISPKLYRTDSSDDIYRKAADTEKSKEIVINFAKTNGHIASSDVVNLLRITETAAYNLLRKLVESGNLIPVNKGRHARYRRKG